MKLLRQQFLHLPADVAGSAAFPAIAQDKAKRPSSAAGGGQTSLAETLARYAATLKYDDLPDDVVRIAKRTILDTLGCAFGGYSAGQTAAIPRRQDVSCSWQ